MIDHLSAVARLAEARARQQVAEGRGRPKRFQLVPAITEADGGPLPTGSKQVVQQGRRQPLRLWWQRRIAAAGRA